MSNCRDSYCNYGSYLRSRGYDKQICNLVNEIENGNINNGAVNPNSNGNGAVVNGSLIVKSLGQANPPASNTRMQEGLIYSFGGQLGSSGEFISNDDLGMQMYKGTRINGPIIQTGNNSYVKANAAGSSVINHVNTNIFKADTHIFTNDGSDCQVLIKGNLVFDGSFIQLPDTYETSLTLQAPATHDREMLTIFHGATEAPGRDIIDVWIDASGNIVPQNSSSTSTGTKEWFQRLAFAIDGDLSANQSIGDNGGTAVHGHTRILRGATVLNPCNDPSTDNAIDISYSITDISDVALDVYGKIKVHEGPTYGGGNKAPANIELYDTTSANPTITLQGDSGDIDFKEGFAEKLTLEGVPNGPGILAGGNPDGLIITDVSNIKFLDGSEIYYGNSLDISSEKVEFLHGDVHIEKNISISGSLFSEGAAIDTLFVGGTPGLRFVSESNSQFKQNVGISGDLIVDQKVSISDELTVANKGTFGPRLIVGEGIPNKRFEVNTSGEVEIDGMPITFNANGNFIRLFPTTSGTLEMNSSAKLKVPNVLNDAIEGNLKGNVTGDVTGNVNGNITSSLVDIDGGAIDGTIIGANSASAGTFTTLESTSFTATSASISTITSAALTNPTIGGGTIDNATIGASTPNTGAFTTLSATSGTFGPSLIVGSGTPTKGFEVDIAAGEVGIDGMPIVFNGNGNDIVLFPNTNGTLQMNSSAKLEVTSTDADAIQGNLTGDVTGNVTGNVTGDLTGNVTGNVNGNITSSSVNITGGSIDGTVIGANSAVNGTFDDVAINGDINTVTNVASSGTISCSDLHADSIIASNGITGSLSGADVSCNITGNAGTVTNGVYTTGNQTIGGNKTFTGGSNIYTGSNIEVNTATFTNDLTVGADIFSVTNSLINIGKSNISHPVRFYSSSTYLDLEASGNDLEIKGHVGNPNPGLKVQKFGLGVTPAGPVTSSSSNNVPDVSGGSLLGLKEDDKWNGGSGTAYSLNDIVRALKLVGILQ